MNENRLLLKYERSKVKQLNAQINNMENDIIKVKEDLQKKIAIYAGYLPNGVLNDKLRTDKSTGF
jgi:Tfp pilus assembly protein PilN